MTPEEEAIQRLTEFSPHYPLQEPIDIPELDAGIRYAVAVLRVGGIETYQSCEGGEGHSFPEPIVQFHGEASEGFRAFALARTHDLPIKDLRRVWSVNDGELVGPQWELTFWRKPVWPRGSVNAWKEA